MPEILENIIIMCLQFTSTLGAFSFVKIVGPETLLVRGTAGSEMGRTVEPLSDPFGPYSSDVSDYD